MTAGADCVVVGGGPAGLTTAYELGKYGKSSIVFEGGDDVGGLSKTCEYRGYRFDIGGHRFFTKVDYVQELWIEILGDEFLSRPRLSRIYYRGKMFDYPLKPMNALLGLGIFESVRIGLSYLRASFFPSKEERNFEQWVSNRFGKRLFEIFFKTYTEKVWGIPCDQISAEWAAQRIKNLDLRAAVINAFLGARKRGGKEVITTLIERFQYPRFGPGQMWRACADKLRAAGNVVELGSMVTRLRHDGQRVIAATVKRKDGTEEEVEAPHFVSTMPVRDLLRALDPPPPPPVVAANDRLRYRDFLTVAVIVDAEELFPDNWIYIHAPDVKVGRIQNYKNWSPDMVPDASKTALGLEYFVQEGDELWAMSDEDLVALATEECERLDLVPKGSVEGGSVIREKKAYPVYDDVYKEALEEIRAWLGKLENLQLVGRNGQHRYNNQDHSMMSGVFAARNIAGEQHDVWAVNVEQDYHEEKREGEGSGATGERLVPGRVTERDLEDVLDSTFARYDPIALGVAVGVVVGAMLSLATVVLLLRGGPGVGYHLSVLSNYLPGYSVSWAGAVIGFFEAAVVGFLHGWFISKLINAIVGREERRFRTRLAAASASPDSIARGDSE